MQHPDDSTLLADFRDPLQKERAFTALVKKYQEKLYWHIRRMVISHDDADDVLQNVFIKIWGALERFREDSKLYTWLYRIATNECLSFLETQKRKYHSVSVDDEEGQAAASTQRLKAESNFDAQKLEWKLQVAINQLPEKQKIVFNLRYFDEMPYEQMSEVLQTSEGALKASYHHAAKKIEAFMLNSIDL